LPLIITLAINVAFYKTAERVERLAALSQKHPMRMQDALITAIELSDSPLHQ